MSDTDIANFTDDNTPYMSAEKTKSLVNLLETTECRILKWFLDNQLIGNGGKYHI